MTFLCPVCVLSCSRTKGRFCVQMVPGAGSVPAIQRIPLPGAEMLEEEPLYVNAKQYHRILKRRQARAKLEAEGKIPKERRVRIKLTSNTGLFPEKGTESHLGWKMRIRILVFPQLYSGFAHELHQSKLSPLRIILLLLGVFGSVWSCVSVQHGACGAGDGWEMGILLGKQ